MPTVYIDLLFLLNFLMNTVTLFTASLFLGRNITLPRLSASAAILALYSSIMFFPALKLLFSVLFKGIILTVSVWLAFPSKKLSVIIKNTVLFFAVNAIFGGIIYALIFATDFGVRIGAAVSNGEIYLNISASSLLLALIPAYGIAYLVMHIRRQTLKTASNISDVQIQFKDRKIKIKGFADTGCFICDPISKAKSIIISKSAAKKLLPADFFEALTLGIPVNLREYASKYRIIPYSTISEPHGILHAFVPDSLMLNGQAANKILVAVAKFPLCENSRFDALFNPDILNSETDTSVFPGDVAFSNKNS